MRKKLLFALLSLLLLPLGLRAQNVTVRTNNGNTIAAVKNSSGQGTADDTFFQHDGFALWKHNQLNLTMTTADSDGADISDIGQFENPANNIFKSSGEALQLGRGNSQDCYVAFTLPKGYRFTKYIIVFRRNINAPTGWSGADGGSGQASFGEAVPSNSWGWYDTDTHVGNMSYSSSAARQTITRTSMTDTDMDNTLYFKLTNSSNNRVFITLESVELFFTAEADYTPLTPAGSFLKKTAVDVPFSTSTIDIGTVENRTYNNATRISYSYENVKDLMGNLVFFEAESVEAGTNYDGISGNVVKYADNGTISSNDEYFQIGRAGETEQIYYIETPTYIELKNGSGTKNPIGYRITGAKIYYTYGEAKAAHSETVTETVQTGTVQYPTFTISGTVDVYTRYRNWGDLGRYYWNTPVSTTYYLTSTAGMSTNESEKASWFRDDEGHIRLASNPDKYLKQGSNNALTVVSSNESPATYNIDESTGQISITQNPNQIIGLSTSTQEARESNGTQTNHVTSVSNFAVVTVNANRPATPRTLTGYNKTINTYSTTTSTVNFPAFTPGNYRLNLYDKTGTTVVDYVDVTSETEDGYLEVTGLNNDAVKIGIVGVGLVQGSITMQALDPYINRMEIVCQESQLNTSTNRYEPINNGNKLIQTFTASDFSVGGDAFHFYVPKSFDKTCLFTFENLYSVYGDNTYYNNTSSTNNARYSFVMSPYWEANPNLYLTDPDATYTNKVIAYLKGDDPYRFNNADEVGTGGGTVEEYPFSLDLYGGATKFSQLYYTNDELTVTATNPATQKIANLFTCDETRYNISTATATQHRIYAFYKMDITAQKEEFTPIFTWTKVYDSTCYEDGDNDKTDAMYGLKLTTTAYTGENSNQYGYLTVSQIVNGINQGVSTTGTLENHTGERPTTKGQILYVDASELLSVMENSETIGTGSSATSTTHHYSEILNGSGQTDNPIGANALVYLPKQNTTNSVGNFAYKGEGNTFIASNDIVLTDKKPFYAPFDISLQEGKYAIYNRLISDSRYGKDALASIMLPFTLSLTEGVHTNDDGSGAFTVSKLGSGTITAQNGSDNYGTSYFTPLTTATTEANKPYMIQVDNSTVPTDKTISFIAKQKGSTIKATPTTGVTTGSNHTGKLVTGDATSVTFDSKTTTFTNSGTFSGVRFDRTDNCVFYFANQQFVSMNELSGGRKYLYVSPFRAVYRYPKGTSSREFSLKRFDISFDEPEEDITGIEDNWKSEADLMIRSDKGSLTITATKAQEVAIFSANGTCVAKTSMEGGDTQTVNLPSGVYVVNNVKIAVK